MIIQVIILNVYYKSYENLKTDLAVKDMVL